jgi:di/tricarboxylate transporter
LFPTAILLSAGGSLLGAGAHLVAADAIAQKGGPVLGYAEWGLVAFPVSMVSTLLGTALILALFVPKDLRSAPLSLPRPEGKADARQMRLGLLVAALVALWAAAPLHGLSIALVALIGAMVMLTKPFNREKTKDVFKSVDMELILFLAATMALAEAMIAAKADAWLAGIALQALPPGLAASPAMAVIFMAAVSVAAHLAIPSRSARAAVLIPAVALPVAAFGHDPALIVMVAVLGSGFCQTMMASAKPVAIYGNLDRETFTQADLFRLALPLMPAVAGPLVAVALWVWPQQLATNAAAAAAPAHASAEARAAGAEATALARIGADTAAAWIAARPTELAPIVSPRPLPRAVAFAGEPRAERRAEAPREERRARRESGLAADLNAAGHDIRNAGRALRTRLGF